MSIPSHLRQTQITSSPLGQARQFHASVCRQHQVPALQYREEFERNGVAGFLSPDAYDIAYVQNMERLVERLNTATKGAQQAISNSSRTPF